MYNIGPTKFTREKWKNFFTAIDQRDWKKAAQESHRNSGDKSRNDWAYKTLFSIQEK
jgi:GH24 family phage-related lysozyme (muramidase)